MGRLIDSEETRKDEMANLNDMKHAINCGPREHRGKRMGQRCTYLDCVSGRAPVPHDANGTTLFQVLMIGGMVTFMTTVNGLRTTGPEFLLQSHWLYPLIFCLTFLVRLFVSSRIVDAVAPRLVERHTGGLARGAAMTVLNVCCTAPIMTGITTLLLHGPDGFWFEYAATLPITMPTAMLVSYFIVGPVVKMLFNNRISPAGGLGALESLSENSSSISRLLGF